MGQTEAEHVQMTDSKVLKAKAHIDLAEGYCEFGKATLALAGIADRLNLLLETKTCSRLLVYFNVSLLRTSKLR